MAPDEFAKVTPTWHMFDVRDPATMEMAMALNRLRPVKAWWPELRWDAFLQRDGERMEQTGPSALPVRHFPQQRLYHRRELSFLIREGRRTAGRALKQSMDPANSTLVLCTPYYWSLAESWPGRVIYYLIDMVVKYRNVRPDDIRYFDRRLSKRADLVCPDSPRVRDYLVNEIGCPTEKILLSPMATQSDNILAAPQLEPGPLPADAADLPRPIAGVIGNLATNMDWLLIRDSVRATPWLSWLFVGPAGGNVHDSEHHQAREELKALGGRVRFVGGKPYPELAAYTRSFDAAVLPYRWIEPTYSGSSTRFYGHLAACRPILATSGIEELRHKEGLLTIVGTPNELVGALESLRATGFRDGIEEQRWMASRLETWDQRASEMIEALDRRSS